MSKLYVGDEGTEILVDVGDDISTATVLKLKVLKPSGEADTWDGTLVGTTIIKYIVQTGDFDESGTYQLQAYVEMPAWKGHGDLTKFVVNELNT
jgi:hypothetical protein